jgi:hypothetical protein
MVEPAGLVHPDGSFTLLPECAEIPMRIRNQDSLHEVCIASEAGSGLIIDIRQHLVHIKSEIPTTRTLQKLFDYHPKERNERDRPPVKWKEQ